MNANWLICLCFGLLAGCDGPTSYQAACADEARLGYSEHRLTGRMFRVRFVSSARTPWQSVDVFLLLRSAQLADANGARAFRLVEGEIDRAVFDAHETSAVATPTTATAAPDVGMSSGAIHLEPHSVSAGMDRPRHSDMSYLMRSDRIILIELLHETKEGDFFSFDTKEVLRRLAPLAGVDAAAPPEPGCSRTPGNEPVH